MLNFSIDVPQFAAVAGANFMLGWLWYSPVAPWFKAWLKGTGLNPDPKAMTAEDKARMPMLFAGALISSLLLSFILQILIKNLGARSFMDGAIVGAGLWAGQVVPALLGTLWEGRKGAVVAINLGNYFVVNTVFGGVLAIWH